MSLRSIVVFGGTGAQAGPIVRHLSTLDKFTITVPTRNTTSEEASKLAKLPNVKLIQANYDTEEGLRAAFDGQESCYFIINSFALREPDEYFWTIRAFEIAVQSGLKHFLYSGARNRLRESGYQERYRNSHNAVKAHLGDCITAQDVNVMGWTIVYGGVYAEMLGSVLLPMKPITRELWFEGASKKGIEPDAPMPLGGSVDDAALFTFRKRFTAWWNMWRDNTAENGRTKRQGEKRSLEKRESVVSRIG